MQEFSDRKWWTDHVASVVLPVSPRATDARHGTEALSRGSLHPLCWICFVSCKSSQIGNGGQIMWLLWCCRSHPAPLTRGMEPKRYRGVRCIRFVGSASCHARVLRSEMVDRSCGFCGAAGLTPRH